jgi:hypothetical protein
MRHLLTNRLTFCALSLALALATAACQFDTVHAVADPQEPNENTLAIENDSELPETSPGVRYEVRLQAHGGTSPFHWHVETGALPLGIKLTDDGLLTGAAEHAGEYQFTVSLRDSLGHIVHKSFVILVHSALSLNWRDQARVNGNRIEGSAEVSNTTGDDIDLTFIVMAVATLDHRGTAIGYQHFVLPRGTKGKELPFGETLPRGGYVVHVDAVGEVAPKKLIYRERLQAPGPLHVEVGP